MTINSTTDDLIAELADIQQRERSDSNAHALQRAMDRIRELEEAQRWISVDERLPEFGHGYVLVLCDGGNVDKTFFSANREFHKRAGGSYSRKDQGKQSGYFELSHKYGYKITHWKLLPERLK